MDRIYCMFHYLLVIWNPLSLHSSTAISFDLTLCSLSNLFLLSYLEGCFPPSALFACTEVWLISILFLHQLLPVRSPVLYLFTLFLVDETWMGTIQVHIWCSPVCCPLRICVTTKNKSEKWHRTRWLVQNGYKFTRWLLWLYQYIPPFLLYYLYSQLLSWYLFDLII